MSRDAVTAAVAWRVGNNGTPLSPSDPTTAMTILAKALAESWQESRPIHGRDRFSGKIYAGKELLTAASWVVQ